MSDLPDIGLIEKLLAFVLRPMLRLEHRGERKVEEVAIDYPLGNYDPFDSPGSTATMQGLGELPTRHGRSKYIRVWVFNLCGFRARGCRVFVERIWHDGRLIDNDRSPLHCTDLDGVFELRELFSGYRRGHYIDICATDSIDRRLQIKSQKSRKGYHRFNASGTYRLELSAESSNPHWAGHLFITVRYDADNWENLRVISSQEGRPFLPWRLFGRPV